LRISPGKHRRNSSVEAGGHDRGICAGQVAV